MYKRPTGFLRNFLKIHFLDYIFLNLENIYLRDIDKRLSIEVEEQSFISKSIFLRNFVVSNKGNFSLSIKKIFSLSTILSS